MAIDDNTTYGLTGAQIKELPGKIKAVKGLARELTADDYNYPTGNPTQIAAWLLPDGLYKTTTEKVYWSPALYDSNATFIKSTASNDEIYVFCFDNISHKAKIFKSSSSQALQYDLLSRSDIVDNLTTANPNFPLSAKQGKVLKDLIDSLVIANAGAPTTSTIGTVGQLLEDTTNGKLYQCTAVDTESNPAVYTWEEVGGGSSVNVVQATGTSITDVMSQNAVTSMVFDDPSARKRIAIGSNNSVSGIINLGCVVAGEANTLKSTYGGVILGNDSTVGTNNTSSYAIAIGSHANATGGHSVALGEYLTASGVCGIAIGGNSFNPTVASAFNSIALGGGQATVQGQFDITTGTNSTNGYNSSNYRLLTGLYDPQSAHDAATKGYVDPTTDSTAPTTSTVGRLGQIQIDTSTATAYMCVAADSGTSTYTWKQITA